MMQLVLTVLAIALAALLAVGGINYFSTDIGVRVEVAQSLRAQHDSLTAAVSNYRMANNGYIPTSVDSLKGFLPDGKVPAFPKYKDAYSWSISKSADGKDYWLCLTANDPSRKTANEGVVSFVRDMERKYDGSVYFGISEAAMPAHGNGCGLYDEDEPNPGSVAPAKSGTELTSDIVSGTTISFRGV